RSILTSCSRSLFRRDLILHLVGDCLLRFRTELSRASCRRRASAQHVGSIGGLEFCRNEWIGRPQRSNFICRRILNRRRNEFPVVVASIGGRFLLRRVGSEPGTIGAIPRRSAPTPRAYAPVNRCGPRVIGPAVVSGAPVVGRSVPVVSIP